jgi:hypothetical protein
VVLNTSLLFTVPHPITSLAESCAVCNGPPMSEMGLG